MNKEIRRGIQEIENDKIHQEFCRKMQETNEQYVRANFTAPEIGQELRQKIRQIERRMRYKRAGRFAAMFTIVLLTGMSFGIWMNADGVYGGKQFSQKVIRLISPLEIYTTVDEDGNRRQTAIVTDWDDLQNAAELCGKLYIPEYIPDGYYFYQLKICKGEDSVQYEYTYEDSEKTPLYIEFNLDSSDKNILIAGQPYRSPRTGEQMYINEIQETNEFSVVKVTDEYECIINGFGSKNVGVRVMENLREF